MSAQPFSPGQPIPVIGQRGDRAERILKILGKVFQHDLPNQLVVLQGLAQLIELEEQDQLTDQGREYLQRLKSVAERALLVGKYAKEMSHLASAQESMEAISLPILYQELRAQGKHVLAGCPLTWDCHWQVVELTGVRPALLRCLVELLSLTVALVGGKSARLTLCSHADDQHVLLEMSVLPTGGKILPAANLWEGRLEFHFARELLTGWGASLQLGPTLGPGVDFLLRAPNKG